MSYFIDNKTAYDFMDLWNEFYSQCAGPEWDDPEYCDDTNKHEWFESWLVEKGHLVYKQEPICMECDDLNISCQEWCMT